MSKRRSASANEEDALTRARSHLARKSLTPHRLVHLDQPPPHPSGGLSIIHPNDHHDGAATPHLSHRLHLAPRSLRHLPARLRRRHLGRSKPHPQSEGRVGSLEVERSGSCRYYRVGGGSQADVDDLVCMRIRKEHLVRDQQCQQESGNVQIHL